MAAADALAGAIAAVTSEAGFVDMMTALGWELDALPAPLAAIATPANALVTAVESLGTDPTPQAVETVRVAVTRLIAAVHALDPSAFPAELLELGQTFAVDAVTQSVIDYLFAEHPVALHALRVLAIVRFDYVPATATRVARIRRRVLWDNISRLLSNPAAAYAEAYGWGTAAFDGVGFLGAVQYLLCALGWPAGLERLPTDVVDALAARTSSDPPGADIGVTLRLFDHDGVTAGLKLVPVPAAGTRLPALSLLPFASAGLAATYPIDTNIDLELDAGLDLQGGIAVTLSPETGIQLVLGLSNPSSASVGTGTLAVGIDVHDPAKQPVTLLALGSLVVSATTLAGRAGATVDTFGGHELFVELELKDATFAFGGGPSDGFVSSHVPPTAGTGFSIALGFSSTRGLYLGGGNGLSLRIPIGAHVGPLGIDAVDVAVVPRGDGVALQLGTELSFTVGPVSFVTKGLGLEAGVSSASAGSLGVGDATLSALLPTAIAIAISGPLVAGGGEITRDPVKARYAGAVGVTIGPFGATAAVVIETSPPPPAAYSFGAAISATFPGIPLGAGFLLTGLGGVVMLNRAPDADQMRAGLRTGAIQPLLFPAPNQLEAAVAAIETMFPAAAGRYVLGPAARIGWGAPQVATAELAILIELPSPVEIIVLGALQLGLPSLAFRVVDIKLDAIGTLDLARQTFALDASLYNSKVAGYTLSGDMALRLGWGDDPEFLLAIGGFHPKFTPPLGFPTLQRLQLTAGDNPQLRLQAYLAITSNTAQIGARADLAYHGGGFTISAQVSFDALFVFTPFQFDVDLSASAAISWHGHNLASIALDAELTGPQPWHAVGTASFSILWWSVSVGFDATWGDATPDPLPPPPDVAGLVRQNLSDPSAWQSQLPPDEPSWLVLAASTTAKLHPLGAVVVRQHVVPLGIPLDEYGNVPLPAPIELAITSVTIGSTTVTTAAVTDAFAPGQFTQLSTDDKLAAPSFEQLDSGVVVGAGAVTTGALARACLAEDTIAIDPLAPPPVPPPRTGVSSTLASWFGVVRGTVAAPARSGPRLAEVSYVLASTATLAKSGVATTYAAAAGARTAGLQVIPIAHAG